MPLRVASMPNWTAPCPRARTCTPSAER